MLTWNAAFDSDQSGSVPPTAWLLKREPVMPIANMLILTGIVLAFVFFAALLVWGDYQTRLFGRAAGQQARVTAQVHSLKQVAQAPDHKEPAPAGGAIKQAARYSPQPGNDQTINQAG
jgi:hypothetical protein